MKQVIVLLLVLAYLPQVTAFELALLIDDLGSQPALDRRVLNLPDEVAVAIIPHQPLSAQLSARAYEQGRMILVHMPMQSMDEENPGARVLQLGMGRVDIYRLMQKSLLSVRHAKGFNNHQGSLLTTLPEPMAWVMEFIRNQPGMLFIDSRTTHLTVAYDMAEQYRIRALWRDIFLDNEDGEEAVKAAFRQWLDKGREQGYALAIAHPRRATLNVLEKRLQDIPALGGKLVTLETLAKKKRHPSWPRYLSH